MNLLLAIIYAAGAVSAASVHSPAHHDGHSSRRAISSGGAWFHGDSHPVHDLFRRGPVTPNKPQSSVGSSVIVETTDRKHYPEVGSSAWTNAYPPDYGDFYAKKMPQAWTDALAAAVAAGKIPNIPVAVNSSTTGEPSYGTGTDAGQDDICSSTAQCRIDGDIWDAPAGVIGIGFDDGPLPASDILYTFLQSQNQTATHYFIGSNILDNHKEFLTAFRNADDIAVHTWSHPLMTTRTNNEVLAELGWTLQIIHDSTGGRVPKYWRPPYGDSDRRVHAIAKEVFGLTGILWNHDTNDWSLTEGGTTPAKIASDFDDWLKGSKSPGLIILEHELTPQSVTAFMKAYPLFAANGWQPVSQARMLTSTPYQNAAPGRNGSIHAANVYHKFKKLKTSLASQPPPTASGLIVETSSSSVETPSSTVDPVVFPTLTSSSSSSLTAATTLVVESSEAVDPSATPFPANQNTSSGHVHYSVTGSRLWAVPFCICLGMLLIRHLV